MLFWWSREYVAALNDMILISAYIYICNMIIKNFKILKIFVSIVVTVGFTYEIHTLSTFLSS